jgi:hypothetical protein
MKEQICMKHCLFLTDTQIEINGNGTVPCIAIGVPVPQILWTRKDGKQLDIDHTETTEHGSLQIIRKCNTE